MKKTTKGLLSALLLTAMCGTVGCKPATSSSSSPAGTSSSTVVNVEAQNLLSSVVDNGDGCYTVTEADGKTTVAFNKPAGKEWAAASVDVSGIANKDRMSTLRFKVSGVGKLLIKFEGDNGACEIGQFVIYDSESKYEWSLLDNSEILAGAKKLLFFAQPGGTGEGQFTLSELTLTPDVAGDDASYQIITNYYTNIKEGSNVYDGAASTFSFNNYWTCNDGDVHTFTEENGAIKVDWTKNPELDRVYAFAKTPISGAFGKFNYINFKVKGTAGQSVMFKAEATGINKEVKIPFDGNEQIYTLDLSEYTDTQRQGMTQILMFAAPGETSGSGTYYVLDAYFSNTFDGTNVAHPVNEYDGVATSFGINQNWHDMRDGVYTVKNDASPWEIEYTNKSQYAFLETFVEGKLGNFGNLHFGLEIAKDKEFLVKVENADGKGYEQRYTGTGECTKFELDFDKLSVSDRNQITKVLICPDSNVEGSSSGNFKIHWMEFNEFKAQSNEYVSGAEFNVNANWQGDTLFNIGEKDGKTTVAWEGATKDNRWSNIYTPYTGDISNFGELEYSITLPANSAIRMSIQNGGGDLGDLVNDTNEAKTFNGYFDLSKFTKEQLAGTEKIMMFPLANIVNNTEVDVVASGTIEIHTLKFVYGRTAIDANGTLDVKAGNWYASGTGYTFTAEDNGMKVSYNETKGYWEMAIMRFDGASLANFTKATLVFTGPESKQCIFKIEGEKGGAAEAKYENEPMTGAQQTAEFDVSGISKDGAVKFIIFADFNSTAVTGDITIHSLTFSA